jgi:cysteine dioxygenase
VPAIQHELSLWFPREEEWRKYIKFDEANPKQYTRNLVFTNQHMDVILMCWPAGCKSSIHDHEESSCWVALVEGTAVEVKFALPKLDRQFLKMESVNPRCAAGRCGPLQRLGETEMRDAGGHPGGYVNNDIGIHRVENRSDKPAYTLHVYAPGLRKMRIFSEAGEVRTVMVPPWKDATGGDVKGEYHVYQETDCKQEVVEPDKWNMFLDGSA